MDTLVPGSTLGPDGKYQIDRHIATGAYGSVFLARGATSSSESQSESRLFAIKQLQPFQDRPSLSTRVKLAVRELVILNHLRRFRHPNVIGLLDVISKIKSREEGERLLMVDKGEDDQGKTPSSPSLYDFLDSSKLFLVFEFMDTDLQKIISDRRQFISEEQAQFILHEILQGIAFIHANQIVHRDLKPNNILVTCGTNPPVVKIADFGFSCVILPSETHVISINDSACGEEAVHAPAPPTIHRALTKHVVTRWYRAPEIILLLQYTYAVDVWSIGCIFAELLSMQQKSVPDPADRKALFRGDKCAALSGEHAASPYSREQLQAILEVLGSPAPSEVQYLSSLSGDGDQGKAAVIKIFDGYQHVEPQNLSRSMFPGATLEALDLLRELIRFSPHCRISVQQALSHKYLRETADFYGKRLKADNVEDEDENEEEEDDEDEEEDENENEKKPVKRKANEKKAKICKKTRSRENFNRIVPMTEDVEFNNSSTLNTCVREIMRHL